MKSGPNRAIGKCLAIVIFLSATIVNAQAERAAVPSKEQQQASQNLLDEGFGVSKVATTAEKQKLVKQLMQEAVIDPKLPKEDLFVVLTTVVGLSQSLRDLPLMNDAVERLITTFNVDPFAERTKHLVRYLEGASLKTAMALKPIYDEVTTLARAAAVEHQYRDAETLLDQVDATLTQMKVAASSRQTLTDLRKEITARKEKYTAFQKAQSVLASKLDDPDANFIVGLWLVIEERDWKLALPHLAKSGNTKPWQAAAALELTPGTDAEKVGNAWWDLAESEGEPTKRELLIHAGQWYEQALPNLTTLSKKLVEQRLSKIAALPKPEAKTTPSSKPLTGTSSARPVIDNEGKLPTRQWIDLLTLIKLPDHVIRGRWRSTDGALIAEPFESARVQAPVAVRGSYEVSCEFTRRSGNDVIGLTIPIGSTATEVFVSGWKGTASGMELIDGKGLLQQPATNRSGVRSGLIKNGRRSRLLVDVDINGDQVSIKATLDDQRFVDWKGRTAQLSCYPTWWHPRVDAVAVSVHESAADIHKLELKLKPNGRAVRLEGDWKNAVAPVAAKPPASVASKCITFKGRSYYFTDKPMNRTQAQELATSLEGRLLTISSLEEEAFVMKEGRGLWFWMAGWRRTEDFTWKDERNRPLKFSLRWAAGEPNNVLNECFIVILTASAGNRGWYDATPDFSAAHAIIEWGEEYPDGK